VDEGVARDAADTVAPINWQVDINSNWESRRLRSFILLQGICRDGAQRHSAATRDDISYNDWPQRSRLPATMAITGTDTAKASTSMFDTNAPLHCNQ
jgi:hypothetical protein